MITVGRKRYHAWSDDLTLGFAIVTNRWSGFVQNPREACVAELFDLCDFEGEILSRSLGRPSATFLFGTDINGHVANKEAWEPPRKEDYAFPAGLVGRRLLTTWSDTTMLSIDKIVGPPERFGISDKKGKCAMLYDLVEVMGETTEVRVGRPQTEGFGRDANSLVAADYMRGPSPWLAEGEDLYADIFDPRPHEGAAPTAPRT